MFKLEEKDYHLVKNLVNSDYISIQLQTVINGTNPGLIYVDSQKSPETAIVYHQGEGGFYFIGNPENEIFIDSFDDFMKMIIEEFKSNDIREFEFSGDSQLWDKNFKILFFDYDLFESTQRVYLYMVATPINIYPIDDMFMVKNVDKQLLNQTKIKGISFVKDEILQWWKNFEDYLKHNIGLVAMKNDKIVARCLLDGSADNMMSISVAVMEKYKEKGIATSLVSEMVKYIIDSGYMPYWECMDDDCPSIKLAEKSSLTLAFTYKLFGFIIS